MSDFLPRLQFESTAGGYFMDVTEGEGLIAICADNGIEAYSQWTPQEVIDIGASLIGYATLVMAREEEKKSE